MINSDGTPVVQGQAVDGQAVNGLSPGKRLSQGRLQLGLTQEQVAKELYITLVKIKALESDDYGRLNTDTFIRGYIRAYANLLKMDVVEVLAAYDQLLQERVVQSTPQPGMASGASVAAKSAQPAAGNPSAGSPSPGSKGALQLLLIIAAFFLGLWLISVWFFNHQPDKNYTALSPVVSLYASSAESASSSEGAASEASSSNEPRSSATSSGDSIGVVRAQLPGLSGSSLSAASSASATKSRTASSSSLSLATTSSQTSAQSAIANSSTAASSLADTAGDKPKSTGLDTISFTFRAECWLEVSDSRGDVLATELQAAGSSLSLVGKAPFDVKLGNAPAVAIQLNSKKIDVIPLLGSNVLTLRVTE